MIQIYQQVRMPLACLLILMYTFSLYCMKKRLHTMTSRVYERLAVMGIVHVLAAVVTEYTVNNRDRVPCLFNHIWHIIFLVSITTVCALLYLYLGIYVERGTGVPKRRAKAMMFAVYLISVAGELVLPIAYVDTPQGSYLLGPKAYALYFMAAYTIVAMLITVFRYRRILNRNKRNVLLASVCIFVVVAGVQILFPYVLITGLGVTMVVLSLTVHAEDVHMYISGDTGMYNELGCREILQELILVGKPFQVGVYAFLGRDDAIEESMRSMQEALPEKQYHVICGCLADNLVVVIPLRSRRSAAEMLELPAPKCCEDVTYTKELMDFDGNCSMDDVFNAAKDFKNRYEETSLQCDELTGLLRRTAFIRQVEYLIKAGRSFTFVMMDLDNFKQVNDTFGHNVGDDLLRSVARVIQNGLRTSDVVCRMGGDEFAFVLDGLTNRESVSTIANRLREEVRRSSWGDQRTGVTISMGAKISIPTHRDRSFQEVYAEADAALYRSKYSGKDRISFVDAQSV